MTDIERLRKAVNGILPYLDHRKNCLFRSGHGPDRDYCNCGVSDAEDELRETFRELQTDIEQP